MRTRIVLALVGVAFLAGAGLYLSPDARGKVAQFFPFMQTAAADTAKGGDGGKAQGVVSVVAATARTANFPIRRYAIGSIASPAVVNVSARTSSQVTSIAVKDGQMVKAGDLLFTLDDRALQAQLARDQATLAKDQALLVSAQADLGRARDLMAKQAGTQQAYDQALAAQKGAEATVQADQAAIEADNVQISYTRITAPIAGRLGAIDVSIGDLVTTSNGGSQSTPMVTITEMNPLQVNFSLPQSDLGLLQQDLAGPEGATVTLHHDGDPTPIGTGKLDFLDSSVDTASGTILARATVPNPDMKLWPGQYVDVVLDAGTMPDMVSVPTVAVQPSQKGPFVYVVKPDDTVEFRPVDVAMTEGEESAVSKGLKSGERIVVEGQLRLQNGTPVREGKEAANSGQAASPKVAQAREAAGAVQP